MKKKILYKLASIFNLLNIWFLKLARRIGVCEPYYLKYEQGKTDKTIIHFIGNFIMGGSSQLVVDIVERMSDEYRHKVVVPVIPEPLHYQPLDIKGFSINEISLLRDFLIEEKPIFVHIHYFVRESLKYEVGSFWYYAVFKVCDDLGIKVIQNINVPTYPYSSKCVVHNVFVSDFVQKNFNNSSITSSVIYPGTDFKHFKNDDIETLPANAIGMVYRLDQDKLSADAIEVFIQVVKKRPDTHCYIIGGGYYLHLYKERVSQEKMNNNFTFTGFISYEMLPAYYRKFGIFVAPVWEESFGQVSPFAMSMGLTIAGYDIGALSEILGYKDTLVEYGNIEGLANIIVDLLNHPDKSKELGAGNQVNAHKKYSLESMINEYTKLYRKIV